MAEIALDVDGDARTVLTGIEEISRTDNLRLQARAEGPLMGVAAPEGAERRRAHAFPREAGSAA